MKCLTGNVIIRNTNGALAQSSVCIGVQNPKGAQAPSKNERFFCAYVMVGCMGALRSAGILWASTPNPCSPSPFRLASFGDGLKTNPKEALIMPVITIADFNSKRPATSLLLTQESRNVSTSKHTPLDEMLPQMPGMLGYSLDLILSEFDYNNEPTTNIGIACRILASLTEYFENNCGGDSHE